MTDLDDRDRLIRATRRATGEKPLVTPCCRLTPELRHFRLWCPCGVHYSALANLVVDERKGAA